MEALPSHALGPLQHGFDVHQFGTVPMCHWPSRLIRRTPAAETPSRTTPILVSTRKALGITAAPGAGAGFQLPHLQPQVVPLSVIRPLIFGVCADFTVVQ